MMKVRNTASFLCGLFYCSKLDLQKKGRTNPRDIDFERQVFGVQSVSGKKYAERNEALIFKWGKTSKTGLLNTELWL